MASGRPVSGKRRVWRPGLADDVMRGHRLVEGQPARRTDSRAARVIERLAISTIVGFGLVFIFRASFTLDGERYFTLFDDMMISLRYGANLASGAGWVLNAHGPSVEGYTNPLWTVWMGLLTLLPVSPRLVPLFVSGSALLLLSAALLVTRALARELSDHPLAGAIAMWLCVLYYPLAYWSLRGTEVALLALLLTSLALLGVRQRERCTTAGLLALGGCAAAAVLTRLDAIVAVAVVFGWLLVQLPRKDRMKSGLLLVLPLAIALGLHEVFRLIYYGQALPNTYYVKVSGIPLRWRLKRGVVTLLVAFTKELWLPLIIGLVGAWSARSRSIGTLLLLLFSAQCAYSLSVGGDVWDEFGVTSRYLVVVTPVLFALAAHGVVTLADAARPASRSIRGLFAAGVVLWFGIRAGDFVPWRSYVGPVPLPRDSVTWRVVGPALVMVALASVAVLLHRHDLVRRSLPLVVVVALAIAMSAQSVDSWRQDRGYFVREDAALATFAVRVREVTSPTTEISALAIGQLSYYSERSIIDLLGKADEEVAHSPPHEMRFWLPGHDKWDYAHSIRDLRPAVVLGLSYPSPQDLRDVASWGYRVLVPPDIFVRADVTDVDAGRLTSLIQEFIRTLRQLAE